MPQTTTHAPVPPSVAAEPVTRRHHGHTFQDDFEWLRGKAEPRVLEHLAAENAYTEAVTADQAPLREAIVGEIKARTVETDRSVPARRDGWWYLSLIHISEPTRQCCTSRMPSSA